MWTSRLYAVGLFNTGARAQEAVDLNADDLQLESPPQVKIVGKGRKTRICPLWPQTAQVIKEFVTKNELNLHSAAPVFCNHRGEGLSLHVQIDRRITVCRVTAGMP